jgi:hypothetical protein
MFVRSSWFIVLFRASILLLICLVLFIIQRAILTSPVIVELSVFPFISVSFCLMYFDAVIR